MPYETFIFEAIRAELATAGLYADEEGIPLSVHLDAIDFRSFGIGKWVIDARFSVPDKPPLPIRYEFPYAVAPGAIAACTDVERALVPAIQGFLRTLYSHPQFTGLLR